MRSISIEAGHGPGYLHGVLMAGKKPRLPHLEAIARVLGISVGEISEGLPTGPDNAELMELWENLSAEKRALYLALGKQLAKS